MADGKRDYKLGLVHGARWAITWLHKRAKEMNDPNAILVLNSAAFNMGVDSRKEIGAPTASPLAVSTREDEMRKSCAKIARDQSSKDTDWDTSYWNQACERIALAIEMAPLTSTPSPASGRSPAGDAGILKPPFEIYNSGSDISDSDGHILTAESPEHANAILAVLNGPTNKSPSGDAAKVEAMRVGWSPIDDNAKSGNDILLWDGILYATVGYWYSDKGARTVTTEGWIDCRKHRVGYQEISPVNFKFWMPAPWDIRALPIETKSPVVDREAVASKIWAARRKYNNDWPDMGELEQQADFIVEGVFAEADAILALLPAGTGDAEAGK